MSQTDPAGRMWTWTYDMCNEVETECDPVGNCTTNTSDENCNLRFVEDALGNTTEHMYDKLGRRTDTFEHLGDGVSNDWHFEYDSFGFLDPK